MMESIRLDLFPHRSRLKTGLFHVDQLRAFHSLHSRADAPARTFSQLLLPLDVLFDPCLDAVSQQVVFCCVAM